MRSKFENLMDSAKNAKATVVITTPVDFNEYSAVVASQGEDAGEDFLIKTCAKNMIEASRRPRISQEKAARVVAFWTPYL